MPGGQAAGRAIISGSLGEAHIISIPEKHVQLHALRIEALSLRVSLGCSAAERAAPQEVRITAEFRFGAAPEGTVSDALEDTVCFDKACQALRAHCEAGEFHLIERLAVECLLILRKLAGDRARIGISIHKVRPPVEGLLGGAVYRCGDFLL